MKLARLGPLGAEIPVLIADDRAYDLRSLTADIDGAFLAGEWSAEVTSAYQAGRLPEIDPSGQRWGAPIARPGAIIGIGLNYAAHAAESGAANPTQPVVFMKPSNTITGPYDDVAIPRAQGVPAERTDWEVELGVVIGRRAQGLNREEAMSAVAGYVTANDLSERCYQLERGGAQWTKGKSAPGFAPVGPWLVGRDELDPSALRLRSWINGEPRQDSSTADMIFDVAAIVADLSQYLVLEPGDLILTGTPEGVALSGRFDYLRAGDVCEIEIEGLGRQRTLFV